VEARQITPLQSLDGGDVPLSMTCAQPMDLGSISASVTRGMGVRNGWIEWRIGYRMANETRRVRRPDAYVTLGMRPTVPRARPVRCPASGRGDAERRRPRFPPPTQARLVLAGPPHQATERRAGAGATQ